MVAELQDQAVKEADVAPKKVFVRDDRPETGGWIIRAPNPEYFGITHGVQFTGGMAIVYLEHPNADFIVQRMEHDFGYEVQAGEDAELIGTLKIMAGIKPPEQSLVNKLAGVSPGG